MQDGADQDVLVRSGDWGAVVDMHASDTGEVKGMMKEKRAKALYVGGREGDSHVMKIRRLIETGKLQAEIGVSELIVEHDDWCSLLRYGGGHLCDCDPTIIFKGEKLA